MSRPAVSPEPPLLAPDGAEQKRRVRSMFDAVAPRYDFLNHLLSAGIDRRWRRRAVAALAPAEGDLILDLCTGTGDLGIAVRERCPGARIVGLDLARGMLAHGEGKRRSGRLDFVQGDAERLPLSPASVDGIVVGFGIRNVASLDAGLREASRVLRPGGRFVILEFTTPRHPLLRRAYLAYFHHLLPRVGGWVSGRRDAYEYLPESVAKFPGPEDLAERLSAAGFARVTWTALTGGIAAIHVGHR